MKVTFVLPGYGRLPGGGIKVVYQLANGLVERGHEACVVHLAFYRRRPSIERGMIGVQAREVVSGIKDSLGAVPTHVDWHRVRPEVELRYERVLSSAAVPDGDVVFATAWQTAESVVRLPESRGVGHYLVQGLEYWSGTSERVDATWRLPLRKFFIAPWLLERARRMGLNDLHLVPAAIDSDRFRATVPLARRRRRVAMLFSEWPGKRSGDCVRVMELVRSRVADVEAVFFGLGPRPETVPSWIEYVQSPSQEVLAAHVYNESSVYLCTSESEGWHLPPAEAMSCGCALVSTAIEGVSDYARPDDTALLHDVGDVRALADDVVRLLADDDLRMRMASAGRAAIASYTWDRSVDALLDGIACDRAAVA